MAAENIKQEILNKIATLYNINENGRYNSNLENENNQSHLFTSKMASRNFNSIDNVGEFIEGKITQNPEILFEYVNINDLKQRYSRTNLFQNLNNSKLKNKTRRTSKKIKKTFKLNKLNKNNNLSLLELIFQIELLFLLKLDYQNSYTFIVNPNILNEKITNELLNNSRLTTKDLNRLLLLINNIILLQMNLNQQELDIIQQYKDIYFKVNYYLSVHKRTIEQLKLSIKNNLNPNISNNIIKLL